MGWVTFARSLVPNPGRFYISEIRPGSNRTLASGSFKPSHRKTHSNLSISSDLRVRAGLPAGLRPDGVRGRRHELRSGRRCQSPREPGTGSRGARCFRPPHGALVDTGIQASGRRGGPEGIGKGGRDADDACLNEDYEPPRDFRRLHFLRGWGHGKTKQILTRG